MHIFLFVHDPKSMDEWGCRPSLWHNLYAKLSQENLLRMARWMRWHCPLDTVLEIRAPVIWGRARSHGHRGFPHFFFNLQVSVELTLCFFETWMPEGGRTRDFYSHNRGHNGPFIAIVVSLYSHQSYRLKCFMTTPQCWNQLKTLW